MTSFNDSYRQRGDNTKTTSVESKTAGQNFIYQEIVALDPLDPNVVVVHNPLLDMPVYGYVLNNTNGTKAGEQVSVQVSELIETLNTGGTSSFSQDKLIGSIFMAEPGRVESDGVLPLIDSYRVVDGATTYPEFAAKWPSFVIGTAIVVPVGFNGAFVRNLGGNADAFAVPQDDATAPNGLNVSYRRPNNSQPDGVGGSGNGVRFVTTQNATVTGDIETRPLNFAVQYYLILDNF